MQVDFMIIGAQKCATTTLFNILAEHPSIVGCDIKEPHFFSLSSNWRNNLPKYENLFKEREDVLFFEASTSYSAYPLRNLRIWDNIYDYNPAMKFIYVVRNPIDRIISSYIHTFERGYTDLPIEKAIIKDRQFIDMSRYSTQIMPYIRKFGRNKIIIIDFEDFVSCRKMVMQDVSNFLGIALNKFSSYENTHFNISIGKGKKHHKFDHPSLVFKVLRKFFPSIWDKFTDNSTRYFTERPTLSLEYKEVIINMLELEINELEKLMNKNLNYWKNIK